MYFFVSFVFSFVVFFFDKDRTYRTIGSRVSYRIWSSRVFNDLSTDGYGDVAHIQNIRVYDELGSSTNYCFRVLH